MVLPLLAVGLWLARRGSLRGRVLWLGALGYLTYTYAVYAVITRFNPFFLGYVALFGLSLYTLVGGLLATDVEAVARRLEDRLPARFVAGYLVVMAGLVALLWLAEIVPATLAGTAPPSVAAVGLPANVVHVLDLGVLLPAMLVAARWLVAGRPWGYLLPGVLLVKVGAIGLAVLGMLAWMAVGGEPAAPVEVAVFGGLTLASLAVAWVYLRALGPGRRPGPPAPPVAHPD